MTENTRNSQGPRGQASAETGAARANKDADGSQEPVLIIGPGAIGVIIGHQLAGLGFSPRFIGRTGPQALDVEVRDARPGGDSTASAQAPASAAAKVLHAWHWPAPSEDERAAARLCFLAVKAYDLEIALATALTTVAPGTVVIPVANGITAAAIARAAAAAPQVDLRIGFCTAGVSVEEGRRYALRSTRGAVHFGAVTPDAAGAALLPIERRLLTSPFFRWLPDAPYAQRRKWLFNVVINSLTAAKRLPRNGDLLLELTLLEAVFDEGVSLGERHFGAWREPRDLLWQELVALIEATADNENSMARDVREGRRTEADWFSGLAVGEEAAFPRLAALHGKIDSRRLDA